MKKGHYFALALPFKPGGVFREAVCCKMSL